MTDNDTQTIGELSDETRKALLKAILDAVPSAHRRDSDGLKSLAEAFSLVAKKDPPQATRASRAG